MIATKKTILFMLICFIAATAIFHFKNDYSKASSITLPTDYFFVFNGQQRPTGTVYEMRTGEVLLNVSSGTWEPETTVQWVTSEPGVVGIESTSYGTNFVKLVRKGPGYSTITAIVRQGTNSFSIHCQIMVDLQLDILKTGLTIATTTQERILILDEINEEKQVFLKYVDYTVEGGTDPITGDEISPASVLFESDNEGVVTITPGGRIKAIGGGSANITITTNTMSSQDRVRQITFRVVVKPTFKLTYDDRTGTTQTVESVATDSMTNPARDVPMNFVIESNATFASDLKWEVFDISDGKKIAPTGSKKLTYSISEISGNLVFSNVKAGTYEILAFAHNSYNKNTKAPYAYMKIVVPIDIRDQNVVMNVGDTYSILENSNIPSVSMFEYYYDVGNTSIARIDQTTGIITAHNSGLVRLRLVYKTGMNLYDGAETVPDHFINITVIDGISLSTNNALIYTSGTLLLQALVTNPAAPIVWTSSDSKTVTVVDGLVTGIKPGSAVITASQTINGVTKTAKCVITVQQSVSSITLDPARVTVPIGGYSTIHATIMPRNLSGVNLTWRSSNEAVVRIVESSALSATIRGVTGGNAVISAINQDNVVVGYTHVSVNQPVTRITLSETNVTLDLSNKRMQLRATVSPENALNKKVNWTSSDPTKARVDENGLVTLLKPGTVTIIATSDDNPKISAMCNINILIPVISVALDEKEKVMYVGQTDRLTYLILPENASNSAVTWTSTNNSVVTVDSTGRVTAKGVGTAVIILRTVDGGRSVFCTITVKRIATAVKFDVTQLDLSVGEYYHIKPTLTPKDSTDTVLVWESSDTKVAIVDPDGKVTARSAGVAVIMARTEAGGVTYCRVTVRQPVKSLLLNFSEKTIFVGETMKFRVSVNPSDATNKSVTWKSSNTRVLSITEEGEIKGLRGGTAVVTVTAADGGHSAICVVTVKEPVTSITLDHEFYNIGIGKAFTLKPTIETDTATEPTLRWTSSNEKIATVNQRGRVTGVALGYATITVTAMDGSGAEASCDIRVINPVTSVRVDRGFVSLLVGESTTIKATINPSNSTYKDLIWTSEDDKIVMVDDDGTITALRAGSAWVYAEAMDNSGKKAQVFVTVRDRLPATAITVMDKKLVMVAGEAKTVQVVMTPTATTDGFVWSSDNTAVASVNRTTGRITARATGIAYITVMTDSGRTATIEVIVIGLNFDSLTLEQYTTYQYPLRVEGATGPVRWSIDKPEIAVVSPNGVVSSRAAGTATIIAIVNGRRLECKLTVTRIASTGSSSRR